MSDTATDNSTDRATPSGEPDKRDREAWLLLALITLGDIDAADTFWRQHVARSREGMLGLDAGWKWDAARQLYISRTGQEVGGAALKRQAEIIVDEMVHEMRAQGQRVATGEIPIDQWQNQQAEDVKDLYLCLAALAAGGWRHLTQEMKDRIEGSPDKPPGIAFSLSRLYDFARNVQNGDDNAGTELMIASRAGMYGQAANGVFEEIRRISHKNARDEKGRRRFLYERNILQPGDNCSDSKDSPGCIEETARGWVPIGTLSVPGTRTCVMNCACSLEYSLTGE